MAHLTHNRPSVKDLVGRYEQERNTTTSVHRRHQRSASADTVSGSTQHSEGPGGDQSATEGAADDEDDEDSSAVKDDELDDETDADDVPARPFRYSRGGKGKGKQPAIRVEPVDDDESHGEDDETASHTTERALIPSKHPVNQLLMSNKKRTFSNLSSTSVLFGDDSTDQESFPRRKIARKLSNAASVPLLTYTDNEDAQTSHDIAIESDDEDYSGVNLVPDDDESDLDMMEKEEESYILQEEQQATTLLNEYRDARRLSLDSCLSDNIFDVTAPLDDTFMAGLPDFGFTPFFEPEAVPASPVPMAKRKFSDGSAKRVRFDDDVPMSDSSSSESSELDSSIFPDLFMDQDKIPPSLHQLLEMDNDDDNGDMASPQSDISFWDFEQNESRITQLDNSDESDAESSESSGYECMVVPYANFDPVTNIHSQPTWVIPLTKRTLKTTYCHARHLKSSRSCIGRPQRLAPAPARLSPFKEVPGPSVAKSHLREASSSTTKLTRLSRSLTGPPRLLASIVLAQC
jgi:hypothetical protein